MSKAVCFDNPTSIGCYNITTSNKDKGFVFRSETGFLANPKIVIHYEGDVIKTLVNGDGLTLVDSNTIEIELQGSWFEGWECHTLQGIVNVFIEGNKEYIFDLEVLKSLL